MEKLIFSFHMPLFFWISGLLAREEIRKTPFRSYAAKKIRTRLVPYLFFSVISYLAWLFLFRHFGTQAELNLSPSYTLVGILYGNGINHRLDHNTVLWFFLCLFVTEMLFFGLIRIPSKKGFILSLVMFAVAGYVDTRLNPPDGFRLPWNIDIALSMVVFYGIGHLCRPWLTRPPWSGHRKWLLLPIATLPYAFFSLLNTKVAVVAGNYGHFIYFYAASIFGILTWTLVSVILPQPRLIRIIGDNTLIIFPLHLLVFPFITAALVYGLKLPPEIKETSVLISIGYAVVSILVLLPVAALLKRWFPWGLGLSPVKS